MLPKPSLGYPSRTEAVLALRAQGIPQRAIAARLRISPSTVSALECAARKRSANRQIALPLNLWLDLHREAVARNTSIDSLTTALLSTIIYDKLFNAILGVGNET